jgi:hypothetical protein
MKQIVPFAIGELKNNGPGNDGRSFLYTLTYNSKQCFGKVWIFFFYILRILKRGHCIHRQYCQNQSVAVLPRQPGPLYSLSADALETVTISLYLGSCDMSHCRGAGCLLR